MSDDKRQEEIHARTHINRTNLLLTPIPNRWKKRFKADKSYSDYDLLGKCLSGSNSNYTIMMYARKKMCAFYANILTCQKFTILFSQSSLLSSFGVYFHKSRTHTKQRHNTHMQKKCSKASRKATAAERGRLRITKLRFLSKFLRRRTTAGF